VLGKSVKFSPEEGKREMGKKVSALREPATRMERPGVGALLPPLHDEVAEMKKKTRNRRSVIRGGLLFIELCTLQTTRSYQSFSLPPSYIHNMFYFPRSSQIE
jgi:hypothetical protein